MVLFPLGRSAPQGRVPLRRSADRMAAVTLQAVSQQKLRQPPPLTSNFRRLCCQSTPHFRLDYKLVCFWRFVQQAHAPPKASPVAAGQRGTQKGSELFICSRMAPGCNDGAVAQLVARVLSMHEVPGSKPGSSIFLCFFFFCSAWTLPRVPPFAAACVSKGEGRTTRSLALSFFPCPPRRPRLLTVPPHKPPPPSTVS